MRGAVDWIERVKRLVKITKIVLKEVCFVTFGCKNLVKMANLKDDLDQYMLMNEERKSTSYKLNIKMPTMPSFLGGTGDATTNNNSNSWLKDDSDGWCPKMNRFQRIIACIVCFGLGTFCLVVSTFYIPVLVFKGIEIVQRFDVI